MMSAVFQPAARVIEICGGIVATAKLIGRDRSVVNRWIIPRERGGTGGRIPMHHAEALRAAVPELTADDLMASPSRLDSGAGSKQAAE